MTQERGVHLEGLEERELLFFSLGLDFRKIIQRLGVDLENAKEWELFLAAIGFSKRGRRLLDGLAENLKLGLI